MEIPEGGGGVLLEILRGGGGTPGDTVRVLLEML